MSRETGRGWFVPEEQAKASRVPDRWRPWLAGLRIALFVLGATLILCAVVLLSVDIATTSPTELREDSWINGYE